MVYFNMMEFFDSPTARKMRLANVASTWLEQREVEHNLETLVRKVLDPLRMDMGYPIHVNSGYRSPALNEVINGAKNSQHMKGMAADITLIPTEKCIWNSKQLNQQAFDYIRDNFDFDQLIIYGLGKDMGRFIHVSYNPHVSNRNQTLNLE